MSYNPSSLHSDVSNGSKSNFAKYQSESLRSTFRTIKISVKSRLARTKLVTQLPNSPSKNTMAPKFSTEPGRSVGTTSQDRGGTNESEPNVKNGTEVCLPEHVWNPSSTYSGEIWDLHSSMPATTSLRSVPEFNPFLAKEADAGAKRADHSEAEVFDRMLEIL